MILMRFLNRIHYNMPMTPMELEMHHQIRNIIGVQPTFYEYCLQIDADTVVAPDSATRMVSAFMQDTRLIGVCGETALTNAKSSMVTMIQVYEYYISHNLTKAFESLFGSVTCLPGCFSMYRIRAQDSGKPLFVSKEVVEGYAENRVDTLHMKNLLHLGEDRYLTTLLLKHHRAYKTKYIFRAHAWTIAPDSWSIFLSQRRRWINSTVHNLVELMPLAQLCGFCCFSMRFIVFLDLLSTIVQPVLMGYIAYLIYLLVTSTSVIPLTAFILLGAIYGLQAVIFIARRKWEMVGWMIVYIFATPIFSFALPLYAFWHMDDFSWGNTRIVTGEKGQKLILSDEGVFDPASIPKKRWEEYQAELWEMHSQYQADAMSAAGTGWRDDRSEASAASYGGKSAAAAVAAANYSRAASRAASRTGSMVDLPAKSRVSLAPTAYGALTGGEDPSAPATSAGASTPGESPSVAGGELPSEDMLLREIRDILASADLMKVTKRDVRAELERRFGCNLRARKEYIKAAMQAVMDGTL
jgi:chitin synthase